MVRYIFLVKFQTNAEKREELISILLKASQIVASAKGFGGYDVYKDIQNENAVWVNEIWNTKEDHDNALKIEGCIELITSAIPLLTAKPETHELELIDTKKN